MNGAFDTPEPQCKCVFRNYTNNCDYIWHARLCKLHVFSKPTLHHCVSPVLSSCGFLLCGSIEHPHTLGASSPALRADRKTTQPALQAHPVTTRYKADSLAARDILGSCQPNCLQEIVIASADDCDEARYYQFCQTRCQKSQKTRKSLAMLANASLQWPRLPTMPANTIRPSQASLLTAQYEAQSTTVPLLACVIVASRPIIPKSPPISTITTVELSFSVFAVRSG